MICTYIYQRGKQKGEQCNNTLSNTSDTFCSKHSKMSNKSNTEGGKKVTIGGDEPIREKILGTPTSFENKKIMLKHYTNLRRVEPSSTEYYKNMIYLDTALAYPWNRTHDITRTLQKTDIKTFLGYIKMRFDNEIYGMDHVKAEILNHVCKMITNPNSKRNNIALYGAAGVGKSKFIKILSDVLGLPLKVISLGGVKDVSFFLGHGYVYVESGPGKIIQNIIDAKVSNPILYFDELDKVSESPNGKDIHAFLSYLTDPTQNTEFTDHYFYGIKFDLSRVFYVFTFNDLSKIDRVLLDRLNIIYIPTPCSEEICTILEEYCIPEIKTNIGITLPITLNRSQISKIVNLYRGNFDHTVSSGIREYYRIIEKIFLYINKDILMETINFGTELPEHQLNDYLQFIQNQTQITKEIEHLYHMYV